MHLQTVLKVDSLWVYCLISSVCPVVPITLGPIQLYRTSYQYRKQMLVASIPGCSGAQIVLGSSHIGNGKPATLSESLPTEFISSKPTCVYQPLQASLRSIFPLFFHVFRLLRISMQWKIRRPPPPRPCPQGQLPQESWCYFATFWAFTVIWLKWEADIFLTRILPWSWERPGSAESCRDGYSGMLKWRQRWCGGVGLEASSSSFCSGFVPHGDGAGSSRRPDQKDFIVVRHVLDPIYF